MEESYDFVFVMRQYMVFTISILPTFKCGVDCYVFLYGMTWKD